jgi:hypothetical protein
MKPQLVVLAFGLMLLSAGAATAQTGDGTEPCVTGPLFEPGAIVNGHHRQPTQGEIEERTRELRAWSKTSAGSCMAMPRSREAFMRKDQLNTDPEGS